MTHARKRKRATKRNKRILRVATWNITSFNTKDQEVVEELRGKQIEISVASRKRKRKEKDKNNMVTIY